VFHGLLDLLLVVYHLQASNGEQVGDGGEGGAERQDDGRGVRRKARGFPRILKAGHGIKLGAVVSVWGGREGGR
jgi:hypothetical protein